jgi:CubicO group peptidase (beta-lactamase class C family)
MFRISLQSSVTTNSLVMLVFLVSRGAAQSSTLPDKIDRFVKAELTRQRIPGMSVAVLLGDSVLLARGYGLANLEHRAPATSRSAPAKASSEL